MPITSIGRDFLNNVSIVGFTTTDNLATVSSVNYIKNQQPIIDALNKGPFTWFDTDTILVNASDGNAFYEFLDATFSTLLLLSSPTGGTITPGTMGNVAIYPATGNTVAGTNNLPNQVQVPVGSLSHGTNASGATFWRGDGTWSRTTGATVSSNSVYVSSLGSDSTGNGTIANPYHTISKAYSTITTATPSSQFNIVLLGGNLSDTDISLKPNINIIGNFTIVTVSGHVTVDPTWDIVSSMATYSFFTLSCVNPVSLDFHISSSSFAHHVEFDTVDITNSNQLLINGTGQEVIVLRSTFGVDFNTPALDVTLSNVSFALNDYAIDNLTYNTNIPSSNTNSFANSTIIIGALTLTCNDPTATINLISIGNFIGSSSVNNIGATLTYDVSDPVPVVTGGGIATPIANTDKIISTHTPVNYTPSPNNTILTSHIAGIDNALGSLISGGLIWNDVTGTSQAALVENAYVADNVGLVTVTLPTTAILGDRVVVQGKGAGGWSLVANTGQTIHVGNTASSVAGHIASTNQWDCIELVCVTANTTWATRSMIGNLTIA